MATIRLDLAKTSVHFVGLDASGRVLTRLRYSKVKLAEVTAKMDPCRIGMEACCGAHHLGRQLLAQGHDVRLMHPKYVKPFVKRDETDTKDAEDCLHPTMRFVAVKSEAQLAMQSLHRHRSRLVGNSTQPVNQARGFLLERGISITHGNHRFAARLLPYSRSIASSQILRSSSVSRTTYFFINPSPRHQMPYKPLSTENVRLDTASVRAQWATLLSRAGCDRPAPSQCNRIGLHGSSAPLSALVRHWALASQPLRGAISPSQPFRPVGLRARQASDNLQASRPAAGSRLPDRCERRRGAAPPAHSAARSDRD